MRKQSSVPAALAAVAVLLSFPLGPGSAKGAKQPTPGTKASLRPKSSSTAAKESAPAGAVATIGGRRVEDADIQRAAVVMQNHPLRKTNHALWRKKLLELCVDRELLALEAERAGFVNAPDVKRQIERNSAAALFAAIRDRDLLPSVMPRPSEIDTARAGGLYRRVKVQYMLTVTDERTTFKLFEELRKGARFDSMAALYSMHSSAAKGLGWMRVRSLNGGAWKPLQHAKPGDVLGPYPNAEAHEIYKVVAIQDPDDAEIREALLQDRVPSLEPRYRVGLLQKYKFQLNSEAVSPAIFASATENADSILASLDAQGFRPKRDIHPALGVLARFEGDSLTYRDIAIPELLPLEADGKAHIHDSRELLFLCAEAALPRLIARDAKERGILKDPAVARTLRLIQEEPSTRAMVAHAVPPMDSARVRAWFDGHISLFQRPSAHRALVAVFASEDTARLAASSWSRASYRDSVYGIQAFQKRDQVAITSLWPRHYGTISLLDTDTDPVSAAARTLEPNQISAVIPSWNGYAIAIVTGREAPRPYSFEEVSGLVAAKAREQAENAWVVSQLERLRMTTPARTFPARLEAVRLGMNSDRGGTRR